MPNLYFSEEKDVTSLEFCKFKCKLFHNSMVKILEPLCAVMTIPELVQFGDGHYQCVVYGLGPYITDYKEQVLLVCIVQGWCGK